jgi:hypothetical protein
LDRLEARAKGSESDKEKVLTMNAYTYGLDGSSRRVRDPVLDRLEVGLAREGKEKATATEALIRLLEEGE